MALQGLELTPLHQARIAMLFVCRCLSWALSGWMASMKC
nr:Mlc titration factor A [Klebsiella pneumoniae]